ncbi:MAG: hypothetical protein HKN72_02900 [Gemmatimonadetes bacterium]|nr:hypothetical protein [Gemmatimonadota bacterium]NNF12142.1 hypothetical protein [Gemmatimonadota bacterium]NNL30845.1 hypothetical protein [Gemmatimonadota bacterium]
MNVVDILVSIVVVTILVTIILAIATYVAYKLRLSREPARPDDDPDALRYFVPFLPGTESEDGSGTASSSALDRLDRDVAGLEDHASTA